MNHFFHIRKNEYAPGMWTVLEEEENGEAVVADHFAAPSFAQQWLMDELAQREYDLYTVQTETHYN